MRRVCVCVCVVWGGGGAQVSVRGGGAADAAVLLDVARWCSLLAVSGLQAVGCRQAPLLPPPMPRSDPLPLRHLRLALSWDEGLERGQRAHEELSKRWLFTAQQTRLSVAQMELYAAHTGGVCARGGPRAPAGSMPRQAGR